MMELDAEDIRFVESIIPRGTIPSGLIAIVTWINPDDGSMGWWVYPQHEGPLSSTVGLLEMAKHWILTQAWGGVAEPEDD